MRLKRSTVEKRGARLTFKACLFLLLILSAFGFGHKAHAYILAQELPTRGGYYAQMLATTTVSGTVNAVAGYFAAATWAGYGPSTVVSMQMRNSSGAFMDCTASSTTYADMGISTTYSDLYTNYVTQRGTFYVFTGFTGSQCNVGAGDVVGFYPSVNSNIVGGIMGIEGVATTTNNNTNAPGATYLVYTTDPNDVPDSLNTNTHFAHIYPPSGTTTATTTVTGADVFVTAQDWEDGMYLQFTFSNQTVNNLGGDAIDAWNSAFGVGTDVKIPLYQIGLNHLVSTTTFAYGGKTEGTYKLVKPSFLSKLWVVGSLFNGSVLISTSTTFIIGQKTGLDVALEQKGAALTSYLLYGTSTASLLQNCKPSTDFDLTDCVVSLITPPKAVYLDLFNQFKDETLSRVPWGYATRFVTILTNNGTTTASSTLPTFTATFLTGPNATSSLTFDMQDTIAGGGTLLDSIRDPNTGKNAKDIVMPIIQLFVAISVLIIIIKDLLAMGQHH